MCKGILNFCGAGRHLHFRLGGCLMCLHIYRRLLISSVMKCLIVNIDNSLLVALALLLPLWLCRWSTWYGF